MLEESILKLSAQLSTISRNQKYFRTRENRNFSTVKSTEKRIFNFSLMEGGLMLVMAGLQVAVVAPTTLLARQHFRTFSERFRGTAVQVRPLSRFVSAKDAAATRAGLKISSQLLGLAGVRIERH